MICRCLAALLTRRTPRSWLVAALVLPLAALTGCQGAYDLPLPGGAAMGGKGYQVTGSSPT